MEMKSFYKNNIKLIGSVVQPGQQAINEMNECFPALIDRLFWHDEENLRRLKLWKTSSLPDYGKLTDSYNETVDHTGSRIS